MQDQDFIKYDPAVRWYGRSIVLYVLGMAGTVALGADYLGLVDWHVWFALLVIGPFVLTLVSLGWLVRANTAVYVVKLLTDGPGHTPGLRTHQQLVSGQPPPGEFTAGTVRAIALVHLAIAALAIFYVYRSYTS